MNTAHQKLQDTAQNHLHASHINSTHSHFNVSTRVCYTIAIQSRSVVILTVTVYIHAYIHMFSLHFCLQEGATSSVYEHNPSTGSISLFMRLPTNRTSSMSHFIWQGVHYLLVSHISSPSLLLRWNGTMFLSYVDTHTLPRDTAGGQKFSFQAMSMTHFQSGGVDFVIAGERHVTKILCVCVCKVCGRVRMRVYVCACECLWCTVLLVVCIYIYIYIYIYIWRYISLVMSNSSLPVRVAFAGFLCVYVCACVAHFEPRGVDFMIRSEICVRRYEAGHTYIHINTCTRTMCRQIRIRKAESCREYAATI
jgi:hypothetical protein